MYYKCQIFKMEEIINNLLQRQFYNVSKVSLNSTSHKTQCFLKEVWSRQVFAPEDTDSIAMTQMHHRVHNLYEKKTGSIALHNAFNQNLILNYLK